MYPINYNGETMKKALSLFVLLLIVGIITSLRSPYLSAQTPDASNAESAPSEDAQKSELQSKIAEYEKKLTEVRAQKNTLAAQIDYMDTQMYIAQLRMDETEQKIKNSEKEINVLGVRIVSLDTSLDKLSKQLLERIVAGYKNRDVTLVDILLDSNNTSKLVNRLKYYDLARSRNQKSLLQVQEAKSNFVEQKDLREKKVEQLDELQTILQQQKVVLDQQKDQKQKILADTQNSESVYQNLLQQAKAQLDSFRSFVQSSGASGIIAANSFGSGSDGAYYSQRDARWATNFIGYSNENVLNVGCLLTSIAMVGKKSDQDVTPASLAADINRFWGNTAWMIKPWPGVAGKSYTPISDIDSELSAGNYVVAGVKISNCNSGGNHFVVITRKDGDDYIMHDPIYGPDLKFSSHYSTICSKATFK